MVAGISSLILANLLEGPLVLFIFFPFLTLFYTRPEYRGFPNGARVVKTGYRGKPQITKRLQKILNIIYIPILFIDFQISGLLLSMVHLICYLQVVVVLTRGSKITLVLLSFLQILASSSVIDTYIFLFVLLVFSFFGIGAIWLEYIGNFRVPQRIFLKELSLLILILVPSSFSLFLFYPRLNPMHIGFSAKKKISGFSKQITLGKFGEIKNNSDIALRLELPEANEGGLGTIYLRGISLDYFDGNSWHRPKRGAARWIPTERGEVNLTHKENLEGALLRQEIYVEKIENDVLFSIGYSIKIKTPFSYIVADGHGNLCFPYTVKDTFHYTVYSSDAKYTKDDNTLKYFRIPEQLRKLYYLKLPEISERIMEFANSVTFGIDDDLEKVKALESKLKSDFEYTTNIAAENIEDFLFNKKKGHCEYFASALAILCRYIGIPSRIVSGFLSDEWNSIGKFYTVRFSHAHAWTEIFIKDKGWIKFDPTPFGPSFLAESVEKQEISFSTWLNSVDFLWRKYILYYEPAIRTVMFRNIVNRFRGIHFSKNIVFAIFSIAIFLAFVIFLIRILKKKISKSIKTTVEFYNDLLRILEKKGIFRQSYLTPMEFAKYVIKTQGENYKVVEILTNFYYKVRFARIMLTDLEKNEVKRLLDGVRF